MGVLAHLSLEGVDKLVRSHALLGSILVDGHNLVGLDFFDLDHIFTLNQAYFNKIEIEEVNDKQAENEDTCNHHQLRILMGLGTLLFVVAHGARHTVGNGQPEGENNVEQKHCEKHYLEDFDHPVRTHKVAESRVPSTVVVAQDEEVGCHVEQQEQQQEPSHAAHQELFSDRVDFR